MNTNRPRSLADSLRGRSEVELTELFLGRPDLAHPAPADISSLARRATATPSVSRTLDILSAPQLHVLFTLRENSMSSSELAESVDPQVAVCLDAQISVLLKLGLVWGLSDSLSAVTSVRDTLTEGYSDALVVPHLPESTGTTPKQDLQMQSGLAAHTFMSLAHDALYIFRTTPLTALRSGGIATKDIDHLAEFLAVPLNETCLLIEVLYHAGLIALTTSLQWEVTTKYEAWRKKSKESQWVALAQSWLDLPLMGSEGNKPLSGTGESPTVGVMRWQTLCTLRWWNENTDTPPTKHWKIFVKALDHFHPRRRGSRREEVAKVTLREAEWIGIAHGEILCEAGIGITADDAPFAGSSLKLPIEVSQFLIQGDLTVIASGPLPLEVGERLHAIADIESRGAASVYRFSVDTVERGMQAGWKAADFAEFFRQWLKGDIPQPLTYLIDNAKEVELAESDAAPRTATAARLGRHSRRITEREAQRIASALLKGEVTEVTSTEPEEVFSLNTSALIALLKSAQEHHTGVWIGYAEADGSTSTQIVEPIRMGDGTMTAFDHGSASVRTFAISRISGIAPAQMNEINN
ncbi:MAG: hypothetical protein GWP22_03335 [Actinomycetales bacterium]|nr:hypothetical protein [Actinomycetales bacterium]